MRPSRLARLPVLPALTLAVFLWSSQPAFAIRNSEMALFGPVGIARGQILRISTYGIGNPNDLPWTFLVRVLDADGAPVTERRLELRPGVTGFVDIRLPDTIPTTAVARRTLRAEIVGFNPQPDPPGEWFTTLEVINARTGRTAILLGGPDTMPGPQ